MGALQEAWAMNTLPQRPNGLFAYNCVTEAGQVVQLYAVGAIDLEIHG